MGVRCEMTPKTLLTVKEVAKMLGCHPMTIYGKVRAGQIPYLRIFGRLKFDPERIATWLLEREAGA